MTEDGTLAAIYARQSKGSAKSVREQKDLGEKACDDNGWAVSGVYEDLVGASIYRRRARDDWARLLTALDAGEFGVLVMWESSRGDRDAETWLGLLRRCRARKVLIHVIDDERTYDPNVATDWRVLAQSGVESDYESRRTSSRIRRDVKASAEQGRPHGGILYGYQRVYGIEQGKRVLLKQEPHPQEAPVVREVITRIAGGEAVSAVAADLDKRGIKPARGREWNRSSIRNIVMNRAYTGNRRYHDEWIPSAWFPPLVDLDIAQGAEELLDGRTKSSPRPGRASNLLSYLAECGECGSLMHLARRPGPRPYMAYRCHRRGCCSIRQDWLDAYVTGHICARLNTDAFWDELERGDSHEAKRARAEEAELRQRLRDYQDQAATGGISPETVAGIDRKIRALITEAQRKAQRATISPLLAMGVQRDKGIDGLRAWFEGKPVAVQREIVRQLYMAVFVFPAGLGRTVPDAKRVRAEPKRAEILPLSHGNEEQGS